jgi:hypothetical protein
VDSIGRGVVLLLGAHDATDHLGPHMPKLLSDPARTDCQCRRGSGADVVAQCAQVQAPRGVGAGGHSTSAFTCRHRVQGAEARLERPPQGRDAHAMLAELASSSIRDPAPFVGASQTSCILIRKESSGLRSRAAWSPVGGSAHSVSAHSTPPSSARPVD